jgi:hypothetical protein
VGAVYETMELDAMELAFAMAGFVWYETVSASFVKLFANPKSVVFSINV